jgi:branched-chain amino acid transport system ATP-binding protein
MEPLLHLENVTAGYDEGTVLEDITLSVEEHSTVALLGRNGVGKTTTLRTIAGLLQPHSGTITFDETDITGEKPHEVYNDGIALVPEDRGVFPDLTVRENLQVPVISETATERSIDELFEFFPQLADLQDSKGKHLSGGEQQMLTIARVLRSSPKLLLLDEPSEGLAPQIVEDVKSVIETIRDEGTTILLVEQNVDMVRDIASYFYIMDAGRIVFTDEELPLEDDTQELEQYLGVQETQR